MKNLLLILLLAASFTSCKKKEEPVPAPAAAPPATPTPTVDPYTYSADIEKTQKINFAIWMLADIPLILGYVFEGNFFPAEYERIPGTGSSMNDVVSIRDVAQKRVSFIFNETDCHDGRLRNGELRMMYAYNSATNPDADPNADNYSDPAFAGVLTSAGYRVNSWFIQMAGSYIKNKNAKNFDVSSTDFHWELNGNFTFTNELLDTIIINGTIGVELDNSQDTGVYKPSGSIRFENAILHYSCDLTGSLNSIPFTYKTDPANPLVRNQSCNAQLEGKSPAPTHYHPFVSGKATFALGNFHPRTTDYGFSCDNSGTISFADEKHTVSLK